MSYGNSSFVILNDGTVKACGRNDFGQLCINNTTQQNSLVIVPVSNVQQIACGAAHTVFLLNDGTAKSCGYNSYGQLGNVTTTNQTSSVSMLVSSVQQLTSIIVEKILKYLIKQNSDNYLYTIDQTAIAGTKQVCSITDNPLLFSSSIQKLNDMVTPITIASETFKPITKLTDKFKLYMSKIK